MTRIWYINHYGGGPGLSAFHRAYQLSRAWRNEGHHPTVFLSSNHHLLDHKAELEGAFEIDGISYRAVPTRSYRGNGFKRLLNIYDFVAHFSAASVGAPVPEVVIASSPHPFAILPAYSAAQRYGAKLIFEIRDIWPLSITEVLKESRFHPFVVACAMAESFALRRSHGVASVLPRVEDYLKSRGVNSKPFVWVPNGLGTEAEKTSFCTAKAKMAADQVAEWRRSGRMVVAHAGAIGSANAVDLLVAAMLEARKAGETRPALLLIGDGNQSSELRALVADENLEGAHFTGRIPKSDVALLLKQVDIGFAGVRPHDNLYKFGLSLNKFADYARAQLPIVLPVAPCGDPVSESGGGIVRRAGTPQDVWKMIQELMLRSPIERRHMGISLRAYMEREYDYAQIARTYSSFWENLDAA